MTESIDGLPAWNAYRSRQIERERERVRNEEQDRLLAIEYGRRTRRAIETLYEYIICSDDSLRKARWTLRWTGLCATQYDRRLNAIDAHANMNALSELEALEYESLLDEYLAEYTSPMPSSLGIGLDDPPTIPDMDALASLVERERSILPSEPDDSFTESVDSIHTENPYHTDMPGLTLDEIFSRWDSIIAEVTEREEDNDYSE